VADLLPLALAAACWPVLIGVDLVALRTPQPARVLGNFIAAGLLTTITVGLLLVYFLDQTSLPTTHRHTFGPVVATVAGLVALGAAWYLLRRRARKRALEGEPKEAGPPSRTERLLSQGGRIAFGAGVLLCIFPGVLPLVALQKISVHNAAFSETFLLVVGFYLVMFLLVEIPFVGFLVAPAATARLTERFNAWLDRNGLLVAAGVLGLAGAYLLVSGCVALAT
jgi:Sap, sulfolipid-1-addressing protein